MTTLQRIVKYCAVAFALFLIVSIIGGSVQAIASVSRIFDHDDVVGKAETYAVDGEIENMDIEISGAELEIRTGSDFSVLTRQNPRQLIVAQELINKVKSKCCGIKDCNFMVTYFDACEILEMLS